MRKLCLALALPLLLATAASAQRVDTREAGEKAATKMSETSAEKFVNKTAAANQFEIDASKLAVDQAKKKEVKELAEALVSDHTAAAETLEAAVRADGKLAPPQGNRLDAGHAATFDQLKATFGDAFESSGAVWTFLEPHAKHFMRSPTSGTGSSPGNGSVAGWDIALAPAIAAVDP